MNMNMNMNRNMSMNMNMNINMDVDVNKKKIIAASSLPNLYFDLINRFIAFKLRLF